MKRSNVLTAKRNEHGRFPPDQNLHVDPFWRQAPPISGGHCSFRIFGNRNEDFNDYRDAVPHHHTATTMPGCYRLLPESSSSSVASEPLFCGSCRCLSWSLLDHDLWPGLSPVRSASFRTSWMVLLGFLDRFRSWELQFSLWDTFFLSL